MVKIIKKFYKPFVITYVFLAIGLGFYPSFNFFSLKGQLILFGVAFFNGIMGIYIKKL
tara:strand:- start:334 stop:507 length:174 start_codon:yes stop_codon:yes gene_type:complete